MTASSVAVPADSTSALPLDHLVINTHFDLPAVAELFQALGFTLTPQGRHAMGSINHLMVFERDYLELIGLPTDGGPLRQEVLDSPVGIDGLVYQPASLDHVHAALTQTGTPVTPIQSFGRPLELDSKQYEARFRTVRHQPGAFEAGRVYYCEHQTPELVWRAEWQQHANKVDRLAALVVVSDHPQRDAQAYADAAFGQAVPHGEGWRIAGKHFRVDVVSPQAYAAQYGDLACESGGRSSFFGAIVLNAPSPQAVRRHVEALGQHVRSRSYGAPDQSDASRPAMAASTAGLAVAVPGVNALLDFSFLPER